MDDTIHLPHNPILTIYILHIFIIYTNEKERHIFEMILKNNDISFIIFPPQIIISC